MISTCLAPPIVAWLFLLSMRIPECKQGHCMHLPLSVRACGLKLPHVLFASPRLACAPAQSTSRRTVVMKSTGKFLVGGNWKCNGTLDSVSKLISELNSAKIPDDIEVVVAPTFVHLQLAVDKLSPRYQVSAQNCWVGKQGAYTGEIAAEQLVDMRVPWVILGHSERRSIFGESSEFVGDKVATALQNGLKVIACIGETLEQREGGQMFSVLEGQLKGVADRISDWQDVVIAYEPVWAIGTGKVASPAQAQEVHAFIRKWLAESVSPDVASATRILYGGSVNDKNSSDLAGMEDIDGFLVGGASLKGASFATICNAKAQVPA